jgi:hypothetical protein
MEAAEPDTKLTASNLIRTQLKQKETKMKASDMFPSKYLKASDAETDLTLTITRISCETMKNRDGQDEEKYVLYFKEVEKGMVINKTNKNTLVDLYGEETDDWIEKRVILTSVDVDAFGETTAALRISHKKPAADKKVLLAHYQKLYEKAKTLKVDGLEDFAVDPNTPEDALIEAGKQLKALVAAAEAFA